MASSKKDLLKAAKREKYFSTLAKKEGKGAEERYKSEKKAGLKASAADSKWETKVDRKFAEIRKKKADVLKRKAKRA